MLLQRRFTHPHLSFKRRTIFITALTFVPLILVIAIFNQLLLGPIQDQLIKDVTNGVDNQISDSNRQISQIENYALNLSLSLDATKLPKSLATLDWDYTDIRNLTNQLDLYINDSTLLKNTVVYVDSKTPYLINPHGTDMLNFHPYTHLIRHQGDRATRWINDKGGLYYIKTVSDAEPSKKVYLISEIDRKVLQKSYSSTIGQNLTFLNIDKERVIGNAPQALLEMRTSKLPRITTVNHHRYHVIVRRYSHSSTLWSYFTLVSLEGSFNPVTNASLIVLAVSAVAFLAMLLIANTLRRTLYNPVRKLVAMAGNSDVITEDEIDYLQNKFQSLLKVQDTATQALAANQKRLKTNFIIQSLQGRFSYYTEGEFFRKASNQGLILDQNHPFIFIHVQLTDTLLPKQSLLTEDIKLSTFMLNNVTTDVSNQCFKEGYIVESGENSVRLFVSCPPATEQSEFANRLALNLNHFLGRWVTTIVSSKMTNWHALKDTYAQFDNAQHLQRLALENQLILLDQIKLDENAPSIRSLEIAEQHILDSLNSGQDNMLVDSTRSFLMPFFNQQLPQSLLINHVKQLHIDVMHLLQQSDIDGTDLLGEQQIARQLEPLFRIEEVQHILVHALLRPALRLLTEQRNTLNQRKITQVIEYLQQNFGDPDVYLEQTAMQFGMDTYILSREIRKFVK